MLSGAAGGLVWRSVTRTPSYQVTRDGAYLDESGLATVFNADGWFLVVGLVGGLMLGWVVATAYPDHGWRLVVGLLAVSAVACVTAYTVGRSLGPPDLGPRLEAASAGERILAPLRVRASGVYLSWPVGAMAGVLFASFMRRRSAPSPGPPRDGMSTLR